MVGYIPTHLPVVKNKKKGVICMVHKNKIKKEETEGYNIEMIDPYDIPSLWIYDEDEKEIEALREYIQREYDTEEITIFSLDAWIDYIKETYKIHPRIEIGINYRRILKSEVLEGYAKVFKVGKGVYVCYL